MPSKNAFNVMFKVYGKVMTRAIIHRRATKYMSLAIYSLFVNYDSVRSLRHDFKTLTLKCEKKRNKIFKSERDLSSTLEFFTLKKSARMVVIKSFLVFKSFT